MRNRASSAASSSFMRAFRGGEQGPKSSKASDGRLKGKLSSRLTTCIGRSRAPARSIGAGRRGWTAHERRHDQEIPMKPLKGTKTHDNLKAAFAGESQANRRYLYFAAKADVEGQNDVAALFRSTAEGETGHAHGHLEYLEAVGDPGDRPADRQLAREPEGRGRRRDARVHRHVPGHGEGGARRRLRARSPTGSRRWRRPSARTPTASRRPSTRWPTERARGDEAARRRARASCVAQPDTRDSRMTREKAASRRPPGIRSTGRTRSSTTRRRSSRSSSASSTSATAAGAA